MNKTQHLKDPGSAITHFIGMLMAICRRDSSVDKGSP